MISPADSPPASVGYRLPPEWGPHAATWLTWPRSDGSSYRDRYEAVLELYGHLIGHLVKVEPVRLMVWDHAMEAAARARLTASAIPLERIQFHHFPAAEPWCRDHGPVFLIRDNAQRHERAVLDWTYNAWGHKHALFSLDDAIPAQIAHLHQIPLFRSDVTLEAGAVDVNGRGSLLTTEACLLNRNRNPHLSQAELAQHLRDYLGVSQVLWLNEGLVGDDTDGHVDNVARFINPTTVVIQVEEDIEDANFTALQENLQRLRTARDQDGRLLRVVKLPTPGLVQAQAQRLPASYLNFYIANGIVLVPTFRRARDQQALEILQREFNFHRVIGVDVSLTLSPLGAIHGLCLQEPL
jgi:agmatine deiminase